MTRADPEFLHQRANTLIVVESIEPDEIVLVERIPLDSVAWRGSAH
jgi:hypothetical protein